MNYLLNLLPPMPKTREIDQAIADTKYRLVWHKLLILDYLENHKGQEVSLSELAQHAKANRVSARIFDLRKMWYKIENRQERSRDDTGTKIRKSFYKLI